MSIHIYACMPAIPNTCPCMHACMYTYIHTYRESVIVIISLDVGFIDLWSMCVCIYIYIYSMYKCTCVCIHLCVYMNKVSDVLVRRTLKCVCEVCKSAYARVYIYGCIWIMCLTFWCVRYVYMYAKRCLRICTYIHRYIHIYIHARAHTITHNCTHTHIYIYTHPRRHGSLTSSCLEYAHMFECACVGFIQRLNQYHGW